MSAVRDLVLVAGLLVSSALGCSLMRDLSIDQCKVDGDCARFGDYTCNGENVCVARETGASGAGNAGESGGGSGGMSGAGGEGATLECEKNADCIAANDGEPYICRDNACVPLTLPEHCPLVIAGPDENPTEFLTKPGQPIIFGAYVPIDAANPLGHPYTLNYRFALEEFMQGTLGGVGSPARPFVMVLCQSTKPDLEASVAHLVDTVRVPGILAALGSNDLKSVLDRVTESRRKVFLLGPLEADSALTAADDQGLLWHMLGPATDLASTYVPLVARADKYLKERVNKSLAGTNLKVAVIHSDNTYSIDMANALQSQVVINGHTLGAKENKDYYQRYQVQVNGPDGPDASAVITELKRGSPTQVNIVIALGGAEFVDPILPAIQEGRTLAETPFYIFSPRNAYDKQLAGGSYFDQVPDWKERILLTSAGVNYASVEDSSLYNEYLTAIQARFQGQEGLESRENFYDAAYFMLYSLAAASFTSSDDFDGDDVVNGMKALVGGTTEATVGPGPSGEMISTVITTLRTGGKVSLTGTLGPPDFNPLTGARRSQGSVWCLTKPGVVHFDVARLDPDAPDQLKATTEFCYDYFIDPPAAE